MRNAIFVLLAACLFARTMGAASRTAPVDLVNPLINTTAARWIFFASACRPFGMVSLAPDTVTDGDWGAGYIYGKKTIRAFSHLHDWQLAGVPVMPVVGSMNGNEGFDAYQSKFSHGGEIVRPGYHKVVLQDYGITAELTSTKRVGFHRYQFPATDRAYVFLDAGAAIGPTTMQNAAVRRISRRELAGFSTMAPTIRRSKPATVYFVVAFDRDFEDFGGWVAATDGKKRKVVTGVSEVAGPESGAYVHFAFRASTPVLMKVAISFVSEEQARLNLNEELPHWDFDRVVRESNDEWNRWLGKIAITGGTAEQRTKFYTDLWHVLLGRHAYSDANGKYTDNTSREPRIRQVPLDSAGNPLRDTYTSDSFWGSQWNLNILWPMAWPQVANDQIASLVDYYRNGGMIARGPSGGNYTFVMVGDQATPLIASAYNKGIRNFDVEAAYAGAVKNAELGGIRDRAGYEAGPDPQGGGMKFYVDRGFVPLGIGGPAFHRAGAAQTLEYAYEDWCLAQFAKALGKDGDYQRYLKRSSNWRNLLDPATRWIRPRNMDGTWLEKFNPTCEKGACPGFVEANSAIYSYFVPQDIPGLIAAVGGEQKFIERLNRQFEQAEAVGFVAERQAEGAQWVNYGNQPSCEMAHLFSHAGAPWLTQYWVRKVKDKAFGDVTPDGGYNGDEDQGQMGGVGALMAIGLFDVQGGAAVDSRYEITAPLFDRVVIELDPRYYRGKSFIIVTRNNRPGNVYIQSATLNGKPLKDRFWITHRDFAAGGTLEIRLGAEPNKSWGRKSAQGTASQAQPSTEMD